MYTHTTYHYLNGDKTMSKRRNGNGHRQRDLAGLIDVYLLRCEVEGKSPNTLHAYAETLRRFAATAQEEGFPSDVSRITLPISTPTWAASPATPWRPATATSGRSAASSTGWSLPTT